MTKQKDKVILQAQKRDVFGKKVKNLRKSGLTPANIYGQGKQSLAVSLKTNEFESLLKRHGGDLGLIYLEVEKKTEPVLVTETVKHPVTDQIVHVEFMRVNLKEEVETEVALEVVGEVDVPNTVLEVIRDEIKIKALPEDIPEHIEVDVSGLTQAGDIITIADLKYDKDKITLLVDEEDMDKPVVVLQAVKEEVEVEEAGEAEAQEGEADAGSEESKDQEESVPEEKES